ncbi:MAG: asparagine N-glycosylation enzyme membrane subunit Stt3 [Chlamydiales bacterium]|jgi:asparagine N-glycosylation enzyme membrane subunit Stt3
MTKRAQTLLMLGVLTLVAFASLLPRRVAHDKLSVDGIDGWVAHDPDTLYHVRRTARALDSGGSVESDDPFLNFPHGARVPWPPYYTQALAAVLRSDLPREPEARRTAIEQGVASIPLYLGVITSLLAALAGFLIAGPPAALFAGVYHAFCIGSIAYSRVGNGDHHAFISMLLALEVVLFTLAVRRRFDSIRGSTALGLTAGAVAGWMLGAWVASLLYILAFQLLLGGFLFVHARRPLPGLAPFGLSFHLGALLVALPAILSSPWKTEFPWMVVNLSWFHAAHLALGALVFLPMLSTAARTSERARGRYPWIVGGVLALLALLVLAIDAGPGHGIREGFEWVSRADQFMAGIQESRPLLNPEAFDGAEIQRLLGHGAAFLPIAWLLALITMLRRGETALAPLVVVVPLLAAQAGAQARFADALSMSMAVLIAWALARLGRAAMARFGSAGGGRTRPTMLLALSLMLASAVLAQHKAAWPIWKQWRATGYAPHQAPRRAIALRSMLEWIRTHTPADGDYSVLANWNQGHAIEWSADRPSVATNFGSYVGVDSYADPGRFFLAEDPAVAEALLDARRARYVLITSGWPNALPDMIRAAWPERQDRYLEQLDGRSGRLRPAWFRTIGARLMFAGGAHPSAKLGAHERLDFMRLVHASPTKDPRPKLREYVDESSFGWVWEHVPGAILECRTTPGTAFTIEMHLEFGLAAMEFEYRAEVLTDEDGNARLRVPYSTLERNGDGWVTGEPRWTIGTTSGPLAISEADVLSGAILRIPPPE